MSKKKNNVNQDDADKKNLGVAEDEILGEEDSAIDPSIIEDTFSEEFSEYNDVDDF